MSQPKFADEAKAIAGEIKIEESRAADALAKLERKKRALLERGAKHFAVVLDGYREQAVASLQRMRSALAALGPAPVQPSASPDPIAYADACEAHDTAVKAHHDKVSAVLLRGARECQALHGAAVAARGEARGLGMVTPEGVAFVPEHVRNHSRYGRHVSDWLGHAAHGESKMLSVADVDRLIEGLSLSRPEAQAPSPDYPLGVAREQAPDAGLLARGWAKLTGADAPAPRRPTPTERDVDRVMSRSPEQQRYEAERQQGIRP